MTFEEVHDHAPLYDEIVVKDVYKLQSLIYFLPDVIFDIGANIGVFTHYARQLFPNALIVSVEPHPANFAALQKYAPKGNRVLLNKAIGQGQMLHYPDVNRPEDHIGAGESYVSRCEGYQLPDIGNHPLTPVAIEGVMLDDLWAKYVRDDQRYAIKIDCEGAENLLFTHRPSVEVLQKADFLAMELHPYWANSTNADMAAQMASFVKGTHRFDSEPPMFYAWKKPDGEPIAGREEFGRLLAERGLLGNAAEIGVCSGTYSRDILNWGVKHLLLVDPWRELSVAESCGIDDAQHEAYYQECLGHIQGCEDRTTILRTTSVEAAKQIPDGSLDWCYIDANHRYEGISVDLPTWWPKVKSGGILAGHDYLHLGLGVNRAVNEFAAAHSLKVHIVIEHQGDGSFWLEKP